MLTKTRGIVFHSTRYGDHSAIVKIYTESSGLLSFMVKGLYSKRSRLRPALFGHLSLLNIEADIREGKNLHFLKEVAPYDNTLYADTEMTRVTVLMFINELLYKTIREEEANPALFNFLIETLHWLHTPAIPMQSFHLLFMMQLMQFLGFQPALKTTSAHEYFDLEAGLFLSSEPVHQYFISGAPARAFEEISSMKFDDLPGFTLQRGVREDLLISLIDYYKLHLPEMGELKSIKILKEVLS
ncbi:MAG: DNA repair protein RecO [Lentimicrobium sp.]|jgi:DNA repair protein RecO (recombination protein O)|nr:DNA repair protein RecO [Lentimicrobium sp.]MDD2527277.1 DNA repair protein RecO [Lentimicrobiaceae bacterium]MDD4596543.1 DNA repair protein RecO [Lentimicrobiaceae bacterium]MDY0024838.1 DNA repair protein RecO [Lentimicrobium sp.]